MAAKTNISSIGGDPQVTIHGGQLVRYRCRFYLWKPKGETWPGTTSRKKKVHDVTLNTNQDTDTFSLGPPGQLNSRFLSWVIDLIVPGGGGPEQYFVEVKIEQDGSEIMNPSWSDGGSVTNTGATGDDTVLEVAP